MNKKLALEKLKSEIEANTKLPLKKSNLVFGEGDINSPVMFIGEAPGKNEDLEKRPFVGRSGQLINKNLEKINWKRGGVYITNIVKKRPLLNRDPNEKEIESFKPYLTKQIEIINPKIIVPLGRFATNYFLPTAKISVDQGKIFEIDGRKIFPMFHPAAALRGTKVMKQFEASFKKLGRIVDNF
ncbi:MAG: DNA polymerase bacteriophage-type [Parcubacteria group bacterium LiPW_30]|nr:MAG: DNA polymerase bacteriophage-type [Parcubacteria group bacterium LiPW_30]